MVLEGGYGLRTRLECYTPLKKALFGSLNVCTSKKFAAACFHFLTAFHAAEHRLYTSNLRLNCENSFSCYCAVVVEGRKKSEDR